MNDSEFHRQLIRSIFFYRHHSSSILKSRTYTLANNARIAVKEPVKFAKKTANLIINNPTKLGRIITGKRSIQNWLKDQENLRNEYAEWIDHVEKPSIDINAQKNKLAVLKKKPLISLITPVFNPPVEAHTKLIESVLAQSYPNFELFLYNFGSDPAVEELLNDYFQKDKRIKVKHGLPNEGISKNSNLCLKDVKGEYVGLLDHDDALMPNALFECVLAGTEKGADFIYSDKDKITEEDQRFEPLFKPDWSPEMALGGNYMTHFNLMRTKLVKDLGGWDPNTDGAQDWDLFLRMIERTNKIVHVPKILYHWRTVEGSTANEIGMKPYAIASQKLAVQKHLDFLGVDAKAEHDETGQLNIHWPSQKETSLIIIHDICGDGNNVARIIEDIVSEDQHSSKSRVVVMCEVDALDKKDVDKIKDLKADIIEYKVGDFCKKLSRVVENSSSKTTAYINNTIKSGNNKDKLRQLLGWLEIEGVNLASGMLLAENGQIADMGSFFNPVTRQFHKYHFGTGFRSGYNGYIQWIRNLILPAENVFVFDTELFIKTSRQLNLSKIRDDELAKALALANFDIGGRAVYDPTVVFYDRAPFEVRLPYSTELKKFVDSKKSTLKTDPYYNQNLDNNYSDPKPITDSSVAESSEFSLKTVDI